MSMGQCVFKRNLKLKLEINMYENAIEAFLLQQQISQYQTIRGDMHMSKQEANDANVDATDFNYCSPSSIIHDIAQQDMDLGDPTYTPPQSHSLLQPPSIFSQPTLTPLLDSYLKIKIKDKPKDTLEQIQYKRQLFLNYAILHNHEKHSHMLFIDSKLKDQSNRSRQEFPQYSFKKSLPEKTVLITTIMPSKHCKCNISVRNLRGEIIKYYPNVFSTKKEGKVLKLITQYNKPILIVNDYTQSESTLKALMTILSASPSIYYSIINATPDKEILSNIEQKLNENQNGVIRSKEETVELLSNSILKLQKQGVLSQIQKRVEKNKVEQRQFLQIFRGNCSEDNRYLAFDMMGVNIWRQFKLKSHLVTDKIIQIFLCKEEAIKSIMGEGNQDQNTIQHVPKRMKTAQNCIQCLVDNPDVKKPKRTYLTCSGCSFLKQKPIYLCRLCLGRFHDNPDIQTFKRNEKRKRIKRYQKKVIKEADKNSQSKEDIEEMADNNQQVTIDPQLKIMMELDQTTDQFFGKIDELINERRLSSAEFFISMLLNTIVVKKKKMESSKTVNESICIIPE